MEYEYDFFKLNICAGFTVFYIIIVGIMSQLVNDKFSIHFYFDRNQNCHAEYKTLQI